MTNASAKKAWATRRAKHGADGLSPEGEKKIAKAAKKSKKMKKK